MWLNSLDYHADAFVYISEYCGPVGTDVQLKTLGAGELMSTLRAFWKGYVSLIWARSHELNAISGQVH